MSDAKRAAFGNLARAYATSLPSEAPLIIVDQGGLGEALAEAARRKERGESVFVRLVLPTECAARIEIVASAITASFASRDERRAAFDLACSGTLHANGRPLADLMIYSGQAVRLLGALVRLADGIVVGSEAERRRVIRITQSDPRCVHMALTDTHVPTPDPSYRRGVSETVVLWGPHLSGDAVYAYALPLAGLHRRVVGVSADAPRDPSFECVRVEGASSVLISAAVIVDLTSHGPESAHALAAWQVPLVADLETGAHEQLGELRTFVRDDAPSIYAAVVAALGRAASLPLSANTLQTNLAVAPEPSSGPLVSVILPTFDRPLMLRRAIESVKRQTYDNIELVIVNDGGPSIVDLVAEYDGVRLITMPENRTYAAMNAAFEATRGKFICFLNDDDVYFPNHVSMLYGALSRSVAAVANVDVLTVFLRGSADDWMAYGFESNMSRAADLDALLVSNQIAMISTMFRRDCIREAWLLDPKIPFYRDYALWLRLATSFDFVHVERITACYTIRNQGVEQASVTGGDRALKAYEAIHARFPIAGRPILEQRRATVLQSITSGHMGLHVDPAVEITPTPWPFGFD